MNDSTQQQPIDDQMQVQTASVNGEEFEIINGVACPIDPYEREMCESCQ